MRRSAIRILIITKSIDGGTGAFVGSLLKITAKKCGYHVRVAVYEKPKYRRKPDGSRYVFGGGVYTEQYTLASIGRVLRDIRWFMRLIEVYKPNIVVSVDSYCIVLQMLSNLIFRYKTLHIATVHNNLLEVIKYRVPVMFRTFVELLVGTCLIKADLVATVSNGLANDLYLRFGLRTYPEVIPYGLSDNNYRYEQKASVRKKDRDTLITIGRLHPQKDVDTILSAYALVEKKTHVRLVIVGDGPEKRRLINKAKQLRLKNAEFVGWIENPMCLMNETDIFVFSSRWEGFGYVILEAMQKGLPVVSTDTPYGPSEILGGGKYGILVPPNNPEKLATILYTLLGDKRKRKQLSLLSRNRSCFYTETKMIMRYLELFKAVTTRNT